MRSQEDAVLREREPRSKQESYAAINTGIELNSLLPADQVVHFTLYRCSFWEEASGRPFITCELEQSFLQQFHSVIYRKVIIVMMGDISQPSLWSF